MSERKAKIDCQHVLSIRRQCKTLDICRSSAYRFEDLVNDSDLEMMRKIDALHLRHPFKGFRRFRDDLWDDDGLQVSRKRVQRLMRQMGIRALYPGAKTTRRNLSHKVYPYLLRDMEIKKVNQVWCTDITYRAHAQRLSVSGCELWTGIPESPLLAIVQQLGYRALY